VVLPLDLVSIPPAIYRLAAVGDSERTTATCLCLLRAQSSPRWRGALPFPPAAVHAVYANSVVATRNTLRRCSSTATSSGKCRDLGERRSNPAVKVCTQLAARPGWVWWRDDHRLDHSQQELNEFIDDRILITQVCPLDVRVLKDGATTLYRVGSQHHPAERIRPVVGQQFGVGVLRIPSAVFGGKSPNPTAQAVVLSIELVVVAAIGAPVLI
jgi:hypothetical protein